MALFEDHVAPTIVDFLARRAEDEFGPKREELLRYAHARVLEIGCGTGFNLRHYPRDVVQLVITDPGRGLLRRARKRAAEQGRSVEAVEAPAEKLPFEDDSFDTAVSTLVLCSVNDQDEALAEVRRVLAPGGSFLFLEHVRSDDPGCARWQDRLDRPWHVVARCHPNRATLERIEAAGFEVVELRGGDLPKSAPIIRPMIAGRAVKRA